MIPINKRLLLENKAWSIEKLNDDPEFFKRLAQGQNPKILWIGCSDSRIPANEITNTQPGDIFVHRNIANIVVPDDPNLLSVIQYAVESLGIENIIICGHSGCGGVKASMDVDKITPPLKDWLTPLVDTFIDHRHELSSFSNIDEQVMHLVKLNVIKQAELLSKIPFVKKRWELGLPLTIHGWVFDISQGRLEEISMINALTKTYTRNYLPQPQL